MLREFLSKFYNKEFTKNSILINDIFKQIQVINSVATSMQIDLESNNITFISFMNFFSSRSDGIEIQLNGFTDLIENNYGFLRSNIFKFSKSPGDIYISPLQIKKYRIRLGDNLLIEVKPPLHSSDKYLFAGKIIKINNYNAEYFSKNKRDTFESLTPIYPTSKIDLEIPNSKSIYNNSLSNRIIDLFVPLGMGQRALIVAPPKSGKTVLLMSIAQAIIHNHPKAFLIVVLIDERPEEAIYMIDLVKDKGLVVHSSFDESPSKHILLAELFLEYGKRLAEMGSDVIILMDSITRLTRAYNLNTPSSGRVLSGGLDSSSLIKPKRFFGSARNLRDSGSLTCISTALVDTGSRMDEVIFEEFKGTGNSEICLERKLSDIRMFPAIDILKSGTRREEYLIPKSKLEKIWLLRKALADMNIIDAYKLITSKISKTKNNKEFLEFISQ